MNSAGLHELLLRIQPKGKDAILDSYGLERVEAIDIMNAEVPALAQTCDAEMLQKVKETMLKHADDAAKTNQYWNNVLQRYQKYGIDIHTDYKQVVSTATPADIQNFMKEFLKDGNKATVIMLPEE